MVDAQKARRFFCDGSFLLRDRELLSSDNFQSWVDVFTSGLEPEEYLPDYGIRRMPSFWWDFVLDYRIRRKILIRQHISGVINIGF